MADLKTLFSEEAAQCRRLAEIATEQGIKEKLLEMAARFQALADATSGASTVPRISPLARNRTTGQRRFIRPASFAGLSFLERRDGMRLI